MQLLWLEALSATDQQSYPFSPAGNSWKIAMVNALNKSTYSGFDELAHPSLTYTES